MRYTLASLALVAATVSAVANPMPQGVTSAITPSGSAPAGCSSSYSGSFEIQVVNVTSSKKRDLEKRQSNALVLTLANGILTDSKGRTGYIAANEQFQFDKPPQTGAIYTAGWSVCSNGSLAIGDQAIWQECLSGDFYNLYLTSNAAQCSPIYIYVIGAGSGSGSVSGAASQLSDGQPTASPVPTPLCQITDGQVQATSCQNPVTQISDGQVQASTGAAVSQLTDGQPNAGTSAAAVSQLTDGQPNAGTSAAAVSQMTDGQPNAATSAAAVTQKTDGQPNAGTGSPVTQISDGQVQASTAASAAPVTQKSDGQPNAPTATAAPVGQISDGQIQASTAAVVSQKTDGQPIVNTASAAPASTTSSAVAQAYTGAAMPTAAVRGELFGLAAGVLAVAML